MAGSSRQGGHTVTMLTTTVETRVGLFEAHILCRSRATASAAATTTYCGSTVGGGCGRVIGDFRIVGRMDALQLVVVAGTASAVVVVVRLRRRCLVHGLIGARQRGRLSLIMLVMLLKVLIIKGGGGRPARGSPRPDTGCAV